MSKMIPGNRKHLTLNDRRFIEQALNEGQAFKDIAKYLCKDPTTISKEIRGIGRSTPGTEVLSTIPTTSASIASAVKEPMSAIN